MCSGSSSTTLVSGHQKKRKEENRTGRRLVCRSFFVLFVCLKFLPFLKQTKKRSVQSTYGDHWDFFVKKIYHLSLFMFEHIHVYGNADFC